MMNMKIRKLASAVALTLASAPAAYSAVYVYSSVPLIGTEETPPVFSQSFGALTATYDDVTNALVYMFEWKFPDGENATAAHFHGPAARGVSAGPVIDLGPVSGTSGRSSGTVTLTEGEEAELLAGMWYINVHSNANPGGEIRGQLETLAPLDTAAVFDVNNSNLYLESVMVPGLGVFDAVLDWVIDPLTLTFQLSGAEFKELDDPDSEDDFSDDDSDDDSGDSSDDSGDDSSDDSSDSSDDSSDDSADSSDDSSDDSADSSDDSSDDSADSAFDSSSSLLY